MTKDRQYLEGLKGLAWDSERETSFEIDEWAEYDWRMMLSQFPVVDNLVEMAAKAGVDGRETFFAISGYEPKGETPTAKAWKALLETPIWQKAKSKAKTRMDKAAVLIRLLQRMGRRKLDQEDVDKVLDLPEDFDLDSLIEMEMQTPEDTQVPTEEELGDAEALMLFISSIGKDLEGEPKEILDEALALSTLINLSTFKDMLGFSSRIVRGASRKAQTARGEMVGYKADSWSDKVIPTEMLAVAKGDLESMVKLAEGQLTVRDFEGEQISGKGPVVLLRDETGSMSYPNKLHSKALSMEVAIAEAFNADGRDLVTVAWGGVSGGGSETRVHTWGEPEVENHLKRNFRSGYTYLYDALWKALDIAESYVPGSDILIVTDGRVEDSSKMNSCPKLKEKLQKFNDDNGRIWVIVLGSLDPDEWFERLPIANGIVQMQDVVTGDGLEKILSNISDRSDPSSMSRRFIY